MNADATLLRGDRMTAAESLRAYLDDLRHHDLAGLDAAILGNAQPMERIGLMRERQRVLARRRSLEATFVAHAAAWSAEERIQRAAFRAEGVPDEVLDRAGIRD